MAQRSFWGWGVEGAGPSEEQAQAMVKTLSARLGVAPQALRPAPRIEDVSLPKPRCAPPDSLADICATQPLERALHTYGRSYRDIVRAVTGDFSPAPDFVAFPYSEAQVTALLDWCSSARGPPWRASNARWTVPRSTMANAKPSNRPASAAGSTSAKSTS